MMTKQPIHILVPASILLILLSSCSKDNFVKIWASNGDDDEELCEIDLETKGGMSLMSSGDYTSATYRAQLFYRGYDINNFPRLDSLITPYTGTYCDPKGTNTWLTPCAVNADFEYDSSASPAEDSRYGLRAGRYHNYYMFLSSPATSYVKYGETTKYYPLTGVGYTMEYWGLPYLRGGDAKDHPAVSRGINVSTTGVNLQNTYIYNVSDTLIEYRSRIAFSVRCGDAITHANFKKLEIKGMRDSAVLRPFTKDFLFEDVPENYEDVVVYEDTTSTGLRLDHTGTSPDEPGISRSLTGLHTNVHLDDTRTNTYFTYSLSGDYKTLDASNKYINKPAEMCLTLLSDLGNPISLDPIPLSFIYEPQKSYFYLITINSVYLEISVTAQSWNSVIVNDTSIDDPNPETLIISIADWTTKINTAQIDPGTGGDDAPRYDKSTGGVLPGDWNTTSGGSGTIDEIKLVDLGLPSGVKWGSCNLGDTWPEEDGLHAAFGADTCNTWMGTKWSVLGFTRVPECEVDANNNLLPEYDAVRTWLPSPWRMPTKAEFEELLDPANCSQSWTSDYNGTGVAGMVFTSVRNSRSIFFPACGYGANAARTNAGTGGYYWSSTKDSDTNAWSLSFTSSAASVTSTARNYGLNIRPVQ